MSYILDALRKADAERERGSVPGIHAQPLAAVLPQVPASRIGGLGGLPDGTGRWLIGCAVAGLAVVGALMLWRATATDTAVVASAPSSFAGRGLPAATVPPTATLPVEPPTATAPAAPPVVPAEAPAVAGLPPPAAAAPSRHPEPAAPSARATAATTATPRLPATSPTAATSPRTLSATATVRAPTTVAAAIAAAPTAAAEPAPQTAGDNRIYQLRELPDEIRRELPALTVGGATYSENAASRMLIINGQVFHENDKLAPELVLERIQLRSAVLRYKGLRYAIAY